MKFSEPAHPAVVFLRTVATLTFVILLVAGIALLAKSASAQSAETQRADVVKLLTDRYGERSVAAGLADNGAVVEVLTAPDGASWTILLIMPDGTSRIMATGESWIALTPAVGQPI